MLKNREKERYKKGSGFKKEEQVGLCLIGYNPFENSKIEERSSIKFTEFFYLVHKETT